MRYAKKAGVSIAYQVFGSGPVDIVFQPGFVSHLDLAWEEPFFARFLEGLGAFARVIWFDKRGIGLSDPIDASVTVDDRVDDALVVMDAAGSSRPTFVGVSEGAALSALFAARHPDRVRSLVLWSAFTRLLASSPDEPGWTPAFFQTFLDTLDRAREDSARDYLGYVNPSVEGDDRFYDWFVRYIRAAGSPAALRNILHENVAIDLEGRAEAVRAPTLLLHRVGDAWVSLASAQDVAKRIPGAKLIELPGIDHWPWLGDSDAVLAEIETFVTGARPSRRRPEWGPRSLTKRETEVARLAADGLSSAEIGARLHIGERTVETHLSNAYLKLGISSRVELARRANEFAI